MSIRIGIGIGITRKVSPVIPISEGEAIIRNDGNTVAWYDYTTPTTITKDGSNRISLWADKLLSGRNIIQADGEKQPLYQATGVVFAGAPIREHLESAPFIWNQPCQIYAVCKQITWTANYYLMTGIGGINNFYLQQRTSSPNLRLAAITALTNYANLAVNTWGIVRIVLNGANSRLQVDNTAPRTGNAGANNPGGFCIPFNGAAPANCEYKEIVLRSAADSVDDETKIYNYLAEKYEFPTI